MIIRETRHLGYKGALNWDLERTGDQSGGKPAYQDHAPMKWGRTRSDQYLPHRHSSSPRSLGFHFFPILFNFTVPSLQAHLPALPAGETPIKFHIISDNNHTGQKLDIHRLPCRPPAGCLPATFLW